MQKKLIVKSNHLIEASYHLTLNEQRVLLIAITQIHRKNGFSSDDVFTIHARDFATQFELNLDGVYGELVKVAERLFERHVIINQPDPNNPKIKKLRTRWISSIIYIPDDGLLLIKFSQDIIPLLTLLERQFTKYKIESISKMTSIYAVRLYELIMQWESVAQREVDINWLKMQFQLETKYHAMKDFKKYVIEPAITQINAHSDLQVSYTQRKTGRVVTHFTFVFSPKTPKHATSKKMAVGEMINGVLKADIERLARAGESYEQARERIKRLLSVGLERQISKTNF